MAHDRFDFEQQIMDCWRITDEISMMEEMGANASDMTSLACVYEFKFKKLWGMFEDVFMTIVRENTMLNEECAALREQLLDACDGYGAGKQQPNSGAGTGVPIIKGKRNV
jgi:hypothetical protein